MENKDTDKERGRLQALIAEASRLSSSVVWDRGLGHATIIEHPLSNFTPDLKLIGPVHPVLTQGDILPVLQALDAIEPGYLLLIQDTIGACALLGDIVMLAAKKKGVAGIICLGMVRDIADASRLALPVWASAVTPRASGLGKAAAPPDRVVLAGHTIARHDWLFGDRDGLVHLPAEQARLVIKAAAIKDKKERVYKNRIHNGEELVVMMNIRGHLEKNEAIKVEF